TQSVIVTPSSSRYYVCHYKNDTGCTVIDSFDVSANPLPNVVASPQNIELCLGDSIEISASGAPQYTWSPDYRISATTGDKIMCSSDIDQEYIVRGTSAAGCIASDTVLLTVESCCFSKAEIQLATNPVICSGESVQFQNNSKSTGTYTYEWLFGATAQPSSFNGENPPLVQFEEGGSYPVQLILTDDCGKDTSIVTIHCIQLSVEAGNDTALCLDDEYKLGTTGISDYEYIWEPCIGLSDCTDPSPTATMADAITYTVTVKDPFSGCEVSDTVSLKERLRVDRVELIDTKLCDGDTFSIQFDLNPNQSILWHNGSTQSYFETRTDERIWLEVSNGTCGFSDSADILFINCGCVAYVPSAFTPNNDALNDGLIPNLDCLVRDYHFTVFSRWGEKLFETFDPTERWDGTYLGNDVQIGSYIWTLDYINIELEISNRESHKGTVTIIR
ncbi:MAG: gliding motility-associated-like protein, partial [Marivirga sp.]